MNETITSLIDERGHWLDVQLAQNKHGSYAIVLKLDGYYASEEDAIEMRDYWHDRLIKAGFPLPERNTA